VFRDCSPALKPWQGNPFFFFTHNYVLRHLAEASHVRVLKSVAQSEVDDWAQSEGLLSSNRDWSQAYIGIVVIKRWLISVREIISIKETDWSERLCHQTFVLLYNLCPLHLLPSEFPERETVFVVNRKYMARAFVKLGTWISITRKCC